jgi:hypothetical protein
MPVSDLVSLVPPPATPVAAIGDWNRVEVELNLELPGDYKEIISIYGAGVLCRLISIPSPFVRPVTASKFWTDWVDFYRDLASYGVDIPYDLFPACPGLLPCGNYADSNNINWLTAPASEKWQLVYYSRSDGFIDIGPISLADFVVRIITGSTGLPARLFPGAIPAEDRFFSVFTGF